MLRFDLHLRVQENTQRFFTTQETLMISHTLQPSHVAEDDRTDISGPQRRSMLLIGVRCWVMGDVDF
eukprot:2626304-Rhodomonas_salina.1